MVGESRSGEYRRLVDAWLREYVSVADRRVGRSGPVCPFIPRALAQQALQTDIRYDITGHSASELLDKLRAEISDFATTGRPEHNTGVVLESKLVVMPGMGAAGWERLDAVYESLKNFAVERGLMIGQFHPHCAERAVRNPDFKVSVAPVAMLAIRHMAPHDILFLHRSEQWFKEYYSRFRSHFERGRIRDSLMLSLYRAACDRHSPSMCPDSKGREGRKPIAPQTSTFAAREGRIMADDEFFDLLVEDAWDDLPEELREEFLNRRTASTEWESESYARQAMGSMRWEPLRPVVIGERAYRGLESLTARLLHLAVDSCRRRAPTVGELHRALRFPRDLPLMDPDRPLVAAELTRYARPDILIEQGRPRFLEFNNSTRLGGVRVTPQLAEAYARLCPQSGLHPPPSSVTARSTALARTLRAKIGHGNGGRVLMPAYWAIDKSTGVIRRYKTARPAILADARRMGLEVVQADLVDLRVDAGGRLLAADVPIDVVLLEWGGNRIVDDGGLAALRAADRARTVEMFPRTESAMISSKAVLSWLHEDCDADLLAPVDRALVRAYLPWTACLGLDGDPAAQTELLRMAAGARDRLVAKPAVGSSGNGVFFGNQTSTQDWHQAVIQAAREAPVVLQHRIEPDRMTMPFHDQESGQRVTAQVPFVLSPFIIDGAAASLAVRHMGPGVAAGDVVISTSRGACQSVALLAPEQPAHRLRDWFGVRGQFDKAEVAGD
jgi:hypothetical protein